MMRTGPNQHYIEVSVYFFAVDVEFKRFGISKSRQQNLGEVERKII